MMTVDEILSELKAYGNQSTKKVLMNHGVKEPFYGVKIQDMKKIVKKVKKDYERSLELYDTGISDAMYLAGLIADENKMTKKDLNKWVKGAYWYMLSEYTVPWITSESKYGYELGLEWIKSDDESIASAGWSTLSNLASIKRDEELDIKMFDELLDHIEKNIHQSQNRVRYAMNGFIIAMGAYIPALTEKALKVGKNVGKVNVDVGGTACKVPLASEYIKKVQDKGRIGKKRKMARC
ncbi:DNA alkylation repair protein [Fulvivirgaceae bacterium BMA10]|uniref:DNA alkylation repair protein n=1 Tax=Splendidivirga corallicola TaxID=3051826 RepID=A0ABT8KJ70_9BACT|nr:DNA alkylation repair protein [Fulvivirgaceae bacterium BMA10]